MRIFTINIYQDTNNYLFLKRKMKRIQKNLKIELDQFTKALSELKSL